MARTLNDMPTAGKSFPPAGQYECTVICATAGRSAKKKTPQIELELCSDDHEFSDMLFVTEKTLGRLCLVAKHVAGMPGDYSLPDENEDAAKEVAKFIMANIKGKRCIVTIEENEETWIPESGPDMGRKMTKKRRRVAFNGYKKIEDKKEDAQAQASNENDDLPF